MKNTDVFKKILESEGMVVHTKEEHQKLQDHIKDLEKKLLRTPIATVDISDLETQKVIEEDGSRTPSSVVTINYPWRDTVRDKDIEVGAFVSDTDSHDPNYPKNFAIRLMTKKIGEYILNQIDDLIADNVVKLNQQSLFHINGTEFRMKIRLTQFT